MSTEHKIGEVSRVEVARSKALANLERVYNQPKETFLREHQISMLEALHYFLQSGERAGYLSEPTGVGKSAVMVNTAAAVGLRTVILSPTQQILDQTYGAAKRFTPDLGITNYDSRSKDLSGQVTNTTYNSIVSLIGRTPRKQSKAGVSKNFNPEDIELVLCDESHLGLGEVRHTIYRDFPNALLIGLTATPDFTPLEGFIQRGIVKKDEDWIGLFRNNIHEMTLEEAMEREILTSLEVHMVRTNTQVGDITITSNGEYSQSDLEKYFAQQSRNALAIAMVVGLEGLPEGVQIFEAQREEIANINRRINGKRTVIFGISIDHVNELAEELNKRGITAAAVHSKIDPQLRTKILEAHTRGEIQVVLGVDMLRIGWDSPATEVSIHLRPTRSGVVKVQELGRVLRPSPETGKTEAIAIELVDQMQKKVQAPVLIPNIFDPEYVLRGTQTGKAPSGTKTLSTREKPVVTFTGMNIETIVEEARSQELLRTRFKQANVLEMSNLFDSILQEVYQTNSETGVYELSQRVIEALPERMPVEAQHIALQALASINSNTVALGKRAMLLLNLKTLVSAVDYHAKNGDEPTDEKDEMIKAAMVAMGDSLQRIKPNVQIAQQIYYPAREAVAVYISNRDSVPLVLVKHPQYRQIVTAVTEIQNGVGQLTDIDLGNIVEELANQTGANKEDLRDYIFLQRRLRLEFQEQMEDADRDTAFEKAAFNQFSEKLDYVVDSLTRRERIAINMKYGLKTGRPSTLKEIANEIGIKSSGLVNQAVAKAFRRLRSPSMSKHIKWYIQDEIPPVTMLDIDRLRLYPRLRSYRWDISNLWFPEGIERRLRRSGIRTFGDFFSAYPEEIAMEWTGRPKVLVEVADRVMVKVEHLISRLNSHTATPSDLDLLNLKELSDAILYRDAQKAISQLEYRQELALAKRLGIINSIIAGPKYRKNEEIVEAFYKLSPYELAATEYRGRKNLVQQAYDMFQVYNWFGEEPKYSSFDF